MKMLMSTMLIVLGLLGMAQAYETEGRVPKMDEQNYSGEGSSDPDLGDLIFYGPTEKPSWESLSNVERVMVGGALGDRQHDTLEPYYSVVAMGAYLYYEAFGVVPAVLDPQTFRSIPGREKTPEYYVEGFRNPLTGNWPHLDATTFSPGDFYIRPLTTAELQQLAQGKEESQRLWFDHKITGYTDRGERDPSLDQPVQISVVLYGRMYGASAPLLSFINTYTGGS